jgi:hypothetical protein
MSLASCNVSVRNTKGVVDRSTHNQAPSSLSERLVTRLQPADKPYLIAGIEAEPVLCKKHITSHLVLARIENTTYRIAAFLFSDTLLSNPCTKTAKIPT